MSIFRKSWLGNLNFFILQWFFIRLAKQTEIISSKKTCNWYLMIGIVPLTGWRSDYIKLCNKLILIKKGDLNE